MIIPQQLVQEIKSLSADEARVLAVDKAVPLLLLPAAEDVVVLCVQLNLILVEIVEEVICTEDLGNLDQLIRVAVAMEERLLTEDHRGKHGTKTPHIQAVVVLLEIDEQLGALEVARCDTDVILGPLVVELGKTPID